MRLYEGKHLPEAELVLVLFGRSISCCRCRRLFEEPDKGVSAVVSNRQLMMLRICGSCIPGLLDLVDELLLLFAARSYDIPRQVMPTHERKDVLLVDDGVLACNEICIEDAGLLDGTL